MAIVAGCEKLEGATIAVKERKVVGGAEGVPSQSCPKLVGSVKRLRGRGNDVLCRTRGRSKLRWTLRLLVLRDSGREVA